MKKNMVYNGWSSRVFSQVNERLFASYKKFKNEGNVSVSGKIAKKIYEIDNHTILFLSKLEMKRIYDPRCVEPDDVSQETFYRILKYGIGNFHSHDETDILTFFRKIIINSIMSSGIYLQSFGLSMPIDESQKFDDIPKRIDFEKIFTFYKCKQNTLRNAEEKNMKEKVNEVFADALTTGCITPRRAAIIDAMFYHGDFYNEYINIMYPDNGLCERKRELTKDGYIKQSEIARDFGVSPQYIDQEKKIALRKMRQKYSIYLSGFL